MKTECGVFGILNISNLIEQETQNEIQNNSQFENDVDDNIDKYEVVNTIQGLKKLQHRGQESWGIAFLERNANNTNNNTINTNNNINHSNNEITLFKKIGYVKDFNIIEELESHNIGKSSSVCIGHVRYSTSGNGKKSDKMLLDESHPFIGNHYTLGQFAICHNGNIPKFPNISDIRNLCNENIEDIDFKNQSDTQIILKLLETLIGNSWMSVLKIFRQIIPGVYCLLLMTKDKLYGIRDIYGVRPLILANKVVTKTIYDVKNRKVCNTIVSDNIPTKKDIISGWCIASETSALTEPYKFFKDISPGEIIEISKNGIITNIPDSIPQSIHCIFEYVYFLRGKSQSDGIVADQVRYQFGISLGKQDISENSKMVKYLEGVGAIVSGVPTTGIQSGKGYAEITGLQYNQFLIKDRSMGRTFILQNDQQRLDACRKKYIIDENIIKGKEIVLVDDSIVRGNTLRIIISMFRSYGVKAVHIRISSPPVKHPCYFGVDIPTHDELIGHRMTIDETCQEIGADSLVYLNLENMKKSFSYVENNSVKQLNFCSACFDGNYNSKLLGW